MTLRKACVILEENIGSWEHGETPYFQIVMFFRPEWKWAVRLQSGTNPILRWCDKEGKILLGRIFNLDITDILATDYEVKHV